MRLAAWLDGRARPQGRSARHRRRRPLLGAVRARRRRLLHEHQPDEAEPDAEPEASDGQIIIAAGNDRLWQRLCRTIGLPELAEDPRFADNESRNTNQPELERLLSGALKPRTTDEWLAVLEAADIPCTPINTLDRVMADPQVAARGMVGEAEHPVAGPIRFISNPIRTSEMPAPVEGPPPLLGQHTDEGVGVRVLRGRPPV
ncbi:MAG: CoA transferase, partial [Chloroflexi bacterium]|nr:CoA transferase [Chloroflexota bacterium]